MLLEVHCKFPLSTLSNFILPKSCQDNGTKATSFMVLDYIFIFSFLFAAEVGATTLFKSSSMDGLKS